MTRGPDLVHGVVPDAPRHGYPVGYHDHRYQHAGKSAMRDSHLVFPGDVLVHGGGYDGINSARARTRVEQFGPL